MPQAASGENRKMICPETHRCTLAHSCPHAKIHTFTENCKDRQFPHYKTNCYIPIIRKEYSRTFLKHLEKKYQFDYCECKPVEHLEDELFEI